MPWTTPPRAREDLGEIERVCGLGALGQGVQGTSAAATQLTSGAAPLCPTAEGRGARGGAEARRCDDACRFFLGWLCGSAECWAEMYGDVLSSAISNATSSSSASWPRPRELETRGRRC